MMVLANYNDLSLHTYNKLQCNFEKNITKSNSLCKSPPIVLWFTAWVPLICIGCTLIVS